MGKLNLYTAVPISRLRSIRKHGLVPNNRLAEILNIEEIYHPDGLYLKGRVFEESPFGYIFGSKSLPSVIEWSGLIQMMVGEFCSILSYEIDEELIELDMSSSNKDLNDYRFKETIKPEDLSFVVGTLTSTPEKNVLEVEEKSFNSFFEAVADYSYEEQDGFMQRLLPIKVNLL